MWNTRSEFEPPAESIDRRLSARYKVPAPVKLLLENGQRVAMMTRDISASGVFIYVSKNTPVRERVRFMVTFPPEATSSCRLLALCDGVVVRREMGAADDGLAIKIDHYEFLSSTE